MNILFEDSSKSKVDLDNYISDKLDALLEDSSTLSKLGITTTSSVTSGSTALLTSGGAYSNLAKLNTTNTFQGNINLNSNDETATNQRGVYIYDYDDSYSPVGATGSSSSCIKRLTYNIAPSADHSGYVGLYNQTNSFWHGCFKFENTRITVLGQSIDPSSTTEQATSKPTLNLSNGYLTNVGTINGYILASACARGVTTAATSGSTSLITSGAVYSALNGKLSTSGGTITGAISPSTNGAIGLGSADHYFSEIKVNTWRSSGTPYWISGSATQSCIIKSLGLYSLAYSSSNTSANFTYAPMYASAFNNKSSKRYKDHKGYITDDQAKVILDLKPVIYDYKNKDNGTDCEGLYAEDVYKLIPYSVTLNDDNEPDSIDYSRLIPRMIKMIQILESRIEELEKK